MMNLVDSPHFSFWIFILNADDMYVIRFAIIAAHRCGIWWRQLVVDSWGVHRQILGPDLERDSAGEERCPSGA